MAVEDGERALAQADEAFGRVDVDAVVAHLSGEIRGFTAAASRAVPPWPSRASAT